MRGAGIVGSRTECSGGDVEVRGLHRSPLSSFVLFLSSTTIPFAGKFVRSVAGREIGGLAGRAASKCCRCITQCRTTRGVVVGFPPVACARCCWSSRGNRVCFQLQVGTMNPGVFACACRTVGTASTGCISSMIAISTPNIAAVAFMMGSFAHFLSSVRCAVIAECRKRRSTLERDDGSSSRVWYVAVRCSRDRGLVGSARVLHLVRMASAWVGPIC